MNRAPPPFSPVTGGRAAQKRERRLRCWREVSARLPTGSPDACSWAGGQHDSVTLVTGAWGVTWVTGA